MEKVKLGEIALLINGDRGKNYPSQEDITDDGEVPFVNAGHLNGKNIDYSDMNYISQEKYEKLSSGKFEKGDILYCLRGSLGKKAIVNDEVRGAIASSLVIIRPDRKKVNGDYLMFSLDAPTIREQLTKANNGSTQPNLSASSVREFRIELPTLLVQKDVVEKLTKLQHVIEKRQNQINLLDKLVKARFVEMFGDPEMNPYGWQKINISNIVQGKVSNGYFAKRDEYVEDGNAAILGVAYIVNRMYSGIEGLPRTNVTLADIQKYKVRYGDMLFCRSSLVAEGIGKASIVPENVPDNTLFECHVIRLPLDMDKCVPEFMQVLSTTDYFRKQMIAQSKTATMTTIGQDGIKKANIILPPIEKQREFYSFVKQIDKSKVVVPSKIKNAIFAIMLSVSFGQITSI